MSKRWSVAARYFSTVYVQAEEFFPLSEVVIRGLHHDLLRYYPRAANFAGGYKKIPNRVVFINHKTGEERVVLDPSPPGDDDGLSNGRSL